MKFKRIIIIYSVLFLISLGTTVKANLTIKASIDSGTYNNAIEVYLITSDKEAKIFYYTDGEGRLDNQKEYKGPITITQETKLNYHAFLNPRDTSLIMENNYYFNYPAKFGLDYKDGEFIIINNNNDTINIGYWKIESTNLKYEIYKNTFLKKGDYFKIDYNLNNGELISLISPDNSVKLDFIKKEIKNVPENENNNIKDNVINKDLNLPEESFNKIDSEKKIESDNNTTTDIKIIENNIKSYTSRELENNIVTDKEENLSKYIKASAIEINNESKDDNKGIFIYIIVFFILSFTVRLIFFLYKNGKINIPFKRK